MVLRFQLHQDLTKTFLKTIRNKKKKHNKVVILAKSKLNSIESKISKALIDNEIILEELKESIRMMNSQRSDFEKVNLIEEGKKIGINEVIKRN